MVWPRPSELSYSGGRGYRDVCGLKARKRWRSTRNTGDSCWLSWLLAAALGAGFCSSGSSISSGRPGRISSVYYRVGSLQLRSALHHACGRLVPVRLRSLLSRHSRPALSLPHLPPQALYAHRDRLLGLHVASRPPATGIHLSLRPRQTERGGNSDFTGTVPPSWTDHGDMWDELFASSAGTDKKDADRDW